jgi:hypothetical protein
LGTSSIGENSKHSSYTSHILEISIENRSTVAYRDLTFSADPMGKQKAMPGSMLEHEKLGSRLTGHHSNAVTSEKLKMAALSSWPTDVKCPFGVRENGVEFRAWSLELKQ